MIKDDKKFVAEFEALKIPPDDFKHQAHLRLAFLYVDWLGVEAAVKRISAGIQAYAAHLEVSDLYNQTVTEALVRLIGIRREEKPTSNWQAFLAANPDLVEDAKGLLLQYYTSERLFSDEARSKFLAPDLLPLGG